MKIVDLSNQVGTPVRLFMLFAAGYVSGWWPLLIWLNHALDLGILW